MAKFNWSCPYCNRGATIQDANFSANKFTFEDGNKDGQLTLITRATTCPNLECREYVLYASLWKSKYTAGNLSTVGDQPLLKWQLKPASSAKPFPDYIPQAIRDDYEEACKVRDLSPKASATLSRRCLQGMVRDFWNIKGRTLKVQIDKLKGRVDSDTWRAIDAVRQIGNIGAHMEKNINLIVDVDPKEADLLIGLIEMLLEEWYIASHERKAHVSAVIELAKVKKEQKSGVAKAAPDVPPLSDEPEPASEELDLPHVDPKLVR